MTWHLLPPQRETFEVQLFQPATGHTDYKLWSHTITVDLHHEDWSRYVHTNGICLSEKRQTNVWICECGQSPRTCHYLHVIYTVDTHTHVWSEYHDNQQWQGWNPKLEAWELKSTTAQNLIWTHHVFFTRSMFSLTVTEAWTISLLIHPVADRHVAEPQSDRL